MDKENNDHLWKKVIETIQEGLMLVEPDGKILYVNQAFETLLGYTLGELSGKLCDIFQCNHCFKAREKGLGKYCSLFRDKEVRSRECTFRRKDGSAIHLLKNASIIYNDDGSILCGVESLIDLTKVRAQEQVIANLRERLHVSIGFHGIIGNSEAMRKIFDLASSTAQSEAPVIVYGESGTGKELLASAIHHLSQRHNEPFIKVNCAALNDNLLESELFGHSKGSFTGADTTRIGRFESAHNGSIFLDEIGDLPLTTQTKLLRVLQEKEIERVGESKPRPVNVRIIAATNKNLNALISQGAFREDLYYRIGVIPINLPPLRERKTDIPLLAEHFIQAVAKKSKKKISGISKEAMDILIRYAWPGNIRELINTIEYAFVICPGGVITPEHLPAQFNGSFLQGQHPVTKTLSPSTPGQETFNDKLLRVLEETQWNRTKTAQILGISRVTVWKHMKKLGLT